MDNYNVNKILSGNQEEAQKWLPFSKSKLDNFRLEVQRIGNNATLQKFIKNDNVAKIRIVTNGDNINKIFIEAAFNTCPNYVSGVIRESYISNNELVEIYPSPKYNNPQWLSNGSLAKKISPFYGIAQTSNSQHVYIKSSMFSGDIRYMVQELLGQNQEVALDYKVDRTNGFMYRNRVNSTYNDQGQPIGVTENPSYMLFQIDKTGLYWKKVSCCKRAVDKNYPYPEPGFSQYIVTPNIVPQFTTFSDDFDTELANGIIIKLLDASQLSPFYDNEVLYPEQGWLFDYSQLVRTYYPITQEDGTVVNKIFINAEQPNQLISNICINKTTNQSEKWNINITFKYDTDFITQIPDFATITKTFSNLYCDFNQQYIYAPDYETGYQFSPNLLSSSVPFSNYNTSIYEITSGVNPNYKIGINVIPLQDNDGNLISWPPDGDETYNMMIDQQDGYIFKSADGRVSYKKTTTYIEDLDLYLDTWQLGCQEVSWIIPRYEREGFIQVWKPFARIYSYNFETEKYELRKLEADYTKLDYGGYVFFYGRFGKGDSGFGAGDPRSTQLLPSFSEDYFSYAPKGSNVFYVDNINDVFDPIYSQFLPESKSFNYLNLNGDIYKNNLLNYPLEDTPTNNLSFIGRPNDN